MHEAQRIREALAVIPASDRETWVRMGMAVKSALGDDGFDLWDEWSQRDETYNERDARDVWKSIRAHGGIGGGTLFHEAQRYGYRPSESEAMPTAEDLEAEQRARAERQAKAEVEEAKRRKDAARKADALWKAGAPAATDHPYLIRKGVAPVATLRELPAADVARIIGYEPTAKDERLAGRILLTPVKIGGKLSTIEMIDGEGRKSALAGGAKAGGFWAAQALPDGDGAGLCILIAEGVATALSVREATGHPAIAALSAGQLAAAARAMRECYPAALLMILADVLKSSGEPDPQAIEAARTVGALLAVPDFGPHRSEATTDFNDLAAHRGREAVKQAIEAAIASVRTVHPPGDERAPLRDPVPSGWPEPKPIAADLPPAPKFDASALLPPLLADYVLDEADRMPCPPDYIAAALIVAIGSVLGSRCALKPKRRDDWIVTPNLFGGCVGDPATKKTPSIEKALRFLERLEADEADRLAQQMTEHEAEIAAHKAREAAIEKIMKHAAGDRKKAENADVMDAAIRDLKALQPPEEPLARRFRTNDATIEKIGDILSKSPEGILVFRDELVGLLSSWEREGREADRAFYLEGWNGLGSFAIDRIGRGSLLVRTLNISVFGGIQPDLLGRYLANIVESSDNDGRIQRFQVLVYPEAVPWEWRDRYPVHGAREKVRDLFLRLASFDPIQDGATPADDFVKVPHFAFDDAAQEVFIEWSADLNHNVVGTEESPLLRQHFAKYEKLYCALALILHLGEERIGPIQADTALRAAAWTQYLAGHARRTYGLLEAQTIGAAQTLASRIAAGKLPDGFTARDVHRKGWAGLGTMHQVEAALALLEECAHVVGHESDEGPGRPTTRYAISPKVRAPGPR